MATDTMKRFREEASKLGDAERTHRLDELLDKIRHDALAIIGLASTMSPLWWTTKSGKPSLEELLEGMRRAAEEIRAATETQIAGLLALADEAGRAWDAMWQAAVSDPAKDRAKETQKLRWMLRDAGTALQEGLRWAQRHAMMFKPPLARLQELEIRANDFPLWARECQACWDMLERPLPALDRDRIARAGTAYGLGNHEAVGEVLSRIQAGGSWEKE
jgi:hypothetical protein